MLKGNPAYVHQDIVSNVMPITTDPHLSKALPGKIDYERLSPYFAFRPHDVIQHTLRQTTQLANLPFITLCKDILKPFPNVKA